MNIDPSPESKPDPQSLLNQIVLDYMKDKKRQRRWRWIRRVVVWCILIALLLFLWLNHKNSDAFNRQPHVGLVDINGEIFDSKAANAEDFAKGMKAAFKSPGLAALILRINSPGGSPVQAEYMYNTINYYKNKYPQIKIYAVCSDACVSAAYYIAVASDEIYASPASIVGSIGVIYNGFGFNDLMQKIGISRRLQTAGVNKAFLDPFSPSVETQKQSLQVMLDIVHNQFIDRVKTGRGSRLKMDDDTFSGLFWTGEQSLARGLIDGFASPKQLARDVIKIDRMVDYTQKQNLFDRVSKNLGTAMVDELPASLGLRMGLLAQ